MKYLHVPCALVVMGDIIENKSFDREIKNAFDSVLLKSSTTKNLAKFEPNYDVHILMYLVAQ